MGKQPESAKVQKQLKADTGEPWNKGVIVGCKTPLTKSEVDAVKGQLRRAGATRDLALFSLAIDSMLRGCDLVRITMDDLTDNKGGVRSSSTILQQKTNERVTFHLSDKTVAALQVWFDDLRQRPDAAIFNMSERHYARLVKSWIESINLNHETYGTHSLRRTKPSIVYEATGNIRAVQLMLGHTRIEHTVKYLGVDDKKVEEIARQFEL